MAEQMLTLAGLSKRIQNGFPVTRHGAEYVIGLSERSVCAWTADSPEDTPAHTVFGEIDPWTGRADRDALRAVWSWLYDSASPTGPQTND